MRTLTVQRIPGLVTYMGSEQKERKQKWFWLFQQLFLGWCIAKSISSFLSFRKTAAPIMASQVGLAVLLKRIEALAAVFRTGLLFLFSERRRGRYTKMLHGNTIVCCSAAGRTLGPCLDDSCSQARLKTNSVSSVFF